MTRWMCAAAMCAVVGLTACGDGGKAAAAAALGVAQESFDAVKAEAHKYAPEQEDAIEDALTRIHNTLARGEYAKVLEDAQAMVPKIATLAGAVSSKKHELTQTWTTLSGGLPQAVDAIQSRIETLSKTGKLPANVKKSAVVAAKNGVDALNTALAEATDTFKKGNLSDAVAQAERLKSKAVALMTSLGMPVPDALK